MTKIPEDIDELIAVVVWRRWFGGWAARY